MQTAVLDDHFVAVLCRSYSIPDFTIAALYIKLLLVWSASYLKPSRVRCKEQD